MPRLDRMEHHQAEGELVAAARAQLEREVAARARLARGCGFALIELSSVLEDEDATLDRAVDPLGVALVAYAARGRRLLRSAYRLLDAGEASEAVPLLRTLSEYFIVGRWLVEHPDRLGAWAMADHERREFVIGRVMDEMGARDGEDEEARAALQQQRDELNATRERWVGERGEPAGDVPTVETMASEIGAGFAYQLAYRVQSQSDVHATPLAADTAYEQLPDGRLRLRAAPAHALSEIDQYALGAHTLRDLLAAVDEHLPGFMWRNGLEGITAALLGAQESDPRRSDDPAGVLAATARPDAAGDGPPT